MQQRYSAEAHQEGSWILPTKDRTRSRISTLLLTVWWVAFCVLAAGFAVTSSSGSLPDAARLLFSPLLVALVWLLVYTLRDGAARWVQEHMRGGYWRRWLILATPLTVLCVYSVIGFGFTIDLGPGVSLAFPLVLYAAAITGVLATVWFLLRRYALQPHHVFWAVGVGGSLAARGGVLPFALFSGDILGSLLLLVYYIPIYGVGPAAACSLLALDRSREKLPTPSKRRLFSVALLSFIFLALT